jgi:hypothetical protein
VDVTNEWYAKTRSLTMARIGYKRRYGGITIPPEDVPDNPWEYGVVNQLDYGMSRILSDQAGKKWGTMSSSSEDDGEPLPGTGLIEWMQTPYGQLFSEIGGTYDPIIEKLFKDVHGDLAAEAWINERKAFLEDNPEVAAEIQQETEEREEFYDEVGGGQGSGQDVPDIVDPGKRTEREKEFEGRYEGQDADVEEGFQDRPQVDVRGQLVDYKKSDQKEGDQQQTLGFVDAQKAAGWQYYEDMRRREIAGYEHQVNPYTNSKDSAAVPPIPPETYDPALLQEGNWDQLQNMAFIVREVAALGREGAMANYGWLNESIDIAEEMLEHYSADYPNFSGGTGGLTTTAGDGGTTAGTTGQPNAGRTSSAAGDVIASWATDVYGHTERDLGASYVKEGGGAVDGWWIPYVPTELNPNSIFLALSNAMLPYLSQTDRQLMGNQMNVFNDEVFANYNAIPKAIMGGESWGDFFNGDRWRNMGLTLKALETALRAKAGGDQALIGSGLMPLRWLIRGIEALQMYVGDNITRLNKEGFQRMYESLMRSAEAQGAAGLDQVFALLVNPYVPGLDSFWDESPNVAIL